MKKFFAFAHDGKQLAVLDFGTGRVHIGKDVDNVFDESGRIFIDPGIRLPNTPPMARTWSEISGRLTTEFKEQLEKLMGKRKTLPLPKVEVHLSPKEEMKRSKMLARILRDLDRPEDTVGDLSVVQADKNSDHHVRHILRALRHGDSVGDISIATDFKERLEKRHN